MRTVYSEYTRHCIRFYVRHPYPTFNTDVDKRNWEACASAFNTLAENDKELLVAIFSENDTLADNVYHVSKKRRINQDTLWKLISELETQVAIHRGLR